MKHLMRQILMVFFGFISTLAMAGQPRILHFQASQTNIDRVQPIRLWWKTEDAVRVDIYDGFRGTVYPSLGSEAYIEVWPERTADYTLFAFGAGGEQVSQRISIYFAPMNIVQFDVSGGGMRSPGEQVNLTWRVIAAQRVEIQDLTTGATYPVGNEGTIGVHPQQNTIYRLNAYDPSGRVQSIERFVQVRDVRPEIQYFSADSLAIDHPRPVRIYWSVTKGQRIELHNNVGLPVLAGLPQYGSADVYPRHTGSFRLLVWGETGLFVEREFVITVYNPN